MTATNDVRWYVDSDGVKKYEGNVGGDYQLTDYWSARLINDVNQSIIDISAYGEGFGWNEDTEEYEGGIGVTVQYEWMECTNREDPGSTEISCNYTYDDGGDCRSYTKEDMESGALLEACRIAVFRQVQHPERDFCWDGHDPMEINS